MAYSHRLTGARVRWRLASVLLALELASAMLVGSPVLASCNPGRDHDNAARYAITAKTVSGITGVSASILEYNPYYSGSNGTGTNATIMLLKRNPTQWGQLGWFKSKIDNGTIQRQVGVEYYISASDNRWYFWPGKTVGSTTPYKILYDAPVWKFYASGVGLTFQSAIPAPTEYQLFGETHDLADQMPGGTGAHEKFTFGFYYTGAGHTSHVMTSAITTDTTYYGVKKVADGKYDIWDKACST